MVAKKNTQQKQLLCTAAKLDANGNPIFYCDLPLYHDGICQTGGMPWSLLKF